MQTQRLASRVAARYLIRQASREAYALSIGFRRGRTAALHDFTPEVVEAFGQGFVEPLARRRVTAAGVAGKIKNLVSLIAKAPQLWAQLKAHLFGDAPPWEGLKSIPAIVKWLPGKLHQLVASCTKLFGKFVEKLFGYNPFSLLAAGPKRLMSVNDFLNRLLGCLKNLAPQALKDFAHKIGGHIEGHLLSFAQWAKENTPRIVEIGSKILNSPLVLWPVYWFIWYNVQEFEWDMKSLAKAAVGDMSFADLWASLPGSAIGRAVSAATGFALGNYALLPYAILLRISWAISMHYLERHGIEIVPNWHKMEAAFGLEPGTLQRKCAWQPA